MPQSYPVLQPLLHDGRPYAPGGTVELTEEQAAPLQAAAVVGAELPPTEPNDPSKGPKSGKGAAGG